MQKLKEIADGAAVVSVAVAAMAPVALLVVGVLAIPAGLAFLLFSAGVWLLGA